MHFCFLGVPTSWGAESKEGSSGGNNTLTGSLSIPFIPNGLSVLSRPHAESNPKIQSAQENVFLTSFCLSNSLKKMIIDFELIEFVGNMITLSFDNHWWKDLAAIQHII